MSAHRGKADIAPQGRDFRFDPSPTSALEKMEAGRSEPPPPTLSAAPNKSILKTFLFFRPSQIAFIQRQRPSIRLKNQFVFNWQVHAGHYLPCVTHSATDEVIPKQECSVSNGNEGHSRRQVLTTVGSLSIAGAMGQAIASSSLASPAAAAQPNSEIAEKTFEATADKRREYARSSLRRQSRQTAKSY